MANGYENLLGWSVGRAAWLDDPASKVNRYWRAIEYGSTYWVGKQIVGLWGDRPGVNTRPNMLRSGQLDPMLRGVDNQKFVPFFATQGVNLQRGARAALMYYLGITMRSRPTDAQLEPLNGKDPSTNRRIFFWLMTRAPASRFPFVSSVIGRPIVAREFYREALSTFGDPAAREFTLLQRGIVGIMGSQAVDVSTSYGRKKARASNAAETNATPRSGRQRGESRSPTGGIVNVKMTVSSQDFLRNSKGQFTNQAWRSMIVDINRVMAKDFQAVLVEAMTSSRHRPATGDLIRATKNPQNRAPQ